MYTFVLQLATCVSKFNSTVRAANVLPRKTWIYGADKELGHIFRLQKSLVSKYKNWSRVTSRYSVIQHLHNTYSRRCTTVTNDSSLIPYYLYPFDSLKSYQRHKPPIPQPFEWYTMIFHYFKLLRTSSLLFELHPYIMIFRCYTKMV